MVASIDHGKTNDGQYHTRQSCNNTKAEIVLGKGDEHAIDKSTCRWRAGHEHGMSVGRIVQNILDNSRGEI